MRREGILKRWWRGVQDSTPEQQLVARKAGIIGQVAGLALVATYIVLRVNWLWLPFFFFAIFVMSIQLIGIEQQLKQLRRFRP